MQNNGTHAAHKIPLIWAKKKKSNPLLIYIYNIQVYRKSFDPRNEENNETHGNAMRKSCSPEERMWSMYMEYMYDIALLHERSRERKTQEAKMFLQTVRNKAHA